MTLNTASDNGRQRLLRFGKDRGKRYSEPLFLSRYNPIGDPITSDGTFGKITSSGRAQIRLPVCLTFLEQSKHLCYLIGILIQYLKVILKISQFLQS